MVRHGTCSWTPAVMGIFWRHFLLVQTCNYHSSSNMRVCIVDPCQNYVNTSVSGGPRRRTLPHPYQFFVGFRRVCWCCCRCRWSRSIIRRTRLLGGSAAAPRGAPLHFNRGWGAARGRRIPVQRRRFRAYLLQFKNKLKKNI